MFWHLASLHMDDNNYDLVNIVLLAQNYTIIGDLNKYKIIQRYNIHAQSSIYYYTTTVKYRLANHIGCAIVGSLIEIAR